MGYNAHGSGELLLKRKIPDDIIESFIAFDEAQQYERVEKTGKKIRCLLMEHYDDRYWGTDIYKDLEKVEPFVESGSIDFHGEDDCVWRFRFDPVKGEFTEDNGRISYEFDDAPVAKKYKGNRHDLLNAVIEVFETFLDEKGILIENDEKSQSENPSNIYGTDYGDLEAELEHELIKWGVLDVQ